ncbi:tail protein X [Pseudomonas sp. ICMP 10191]|uniref:tail protein X n=1 Tax=Pseudomonas sp. ICMP 10191 TaxID=1198294 RepID=UPI0009FA423B|nr:tail protein X [Pseudomonas sp. ICMP 10191]
MTDAIRYETQVIEGYVTNQGDTIDYIAWKIYGTDQNRTVERLLAANPNLADQGVIFPAGIKIETPKFETISSKGISLWT